MLLIQGIRTMVPEIDGKHLVSKHFQESKKQPVPRADVKHMPVFSERISNVAKAIY